MGLIKAITSTVGGALADQWLEVIEANDMDNQTLCTNGVFVQRDDRRKGSNVKGTTDVISNGSKIHVYPNQFMMLVDGGKIIDYTAEPGYYTVDNSSQPSFLNGEFGDALKESLERFRFGGVTSQRQKVYFINLQEIRGIKFGTPNPVNYFDSFYNAELRLRSFGNYSIKVTDPLLFFNEVVPRNASRVQVDDVNDQFLSEYLNAFQTSIGQMSADGISIRQIQSKTMDLARYMRDALDEEWRSLRGFEIIAVGINSISYDSKSQELIDMRNQAGMLSDPNIRETYVQTSVARGLEAAGSNEGGATQAFMGMGLGMQAGGNFMGAASQSNQSQAWQQQQQEAAAGQAAAASADTWTCGECNHSNAGSANFCSNCGTKRPETQANRFCPECGTKVESPDAKFCSGCGSKL